MSEESLPDIPMLAEAPVPLEIIVSEEQIADVILDEVEQEKIEQHQIAETTEQHQIAETTEDLKLKDLVNHLKFSFHTPTDIVKLIANGIKYAEKYINLTGPAKKALVMEAVNLVIASSDLSKEAKETVTNLTNIIADPVVDSLVEFGNDAILLVKSKVKEIIEKVKNLIFKLCVCRSSSENVTPDVSAEIVEQLTTLLTEKISNLHLCATEVKPDIIVSLISDAVKFMTDKKTIVGLAKKSTVLSVTRNVVRSSEHFSQQEKKYLLDIVDTIGATFIDAAVGIKF